MALMSAMRTTTQCRWWNARPGPRLMWLMEGNLGTRAAGPMWAAHNAPARTSCARAVHENASTRSGWVAVKCHAAPKRAWGARGHLFTAAAAATTGGCGSPPKTFFVPLFRRAGCACACVRILLHSSPRLLFLSPREMLLLSAAASVASATMSAPAGGAAAARSFLLEASASCCAIIALRWRIADASSESP